MTPHEETADLAIFKINLLLNQMKLRFESFPTEESKIFCTRSESFTKMALKEQTGQGFKFSWSDCCFGSFSNLVSILNWLK